MRRKGGGSERSREKVMTETRYMKFSKNLKKKRKIPWPILDPEQTWGFEA